MNSDLNHGVAASEQVSPALLNVDSRTPPPLGAVEGSVASVMSKRVDQAYDAYVNYHRLKEAGVAPSIEDYCAQFPSLKTHLQNLIHFDQKLEENPQLLDESSMFPWPIPGSTFERFRVLREIGQGGFAHVYLALDSSLGDRPVVLKVSTTKSPEAKLLGPISHPNVVGVLSTHEDKDVELVAVCMPYVGTATLRTVLQAMRADTPPLTHAREILAAIQAEEMPGDPAIPASHPAEIFRRGTYVDGICHIVAQIADGLAHIHARDICHRDLKPSNILIRRDGVPLLLDFNLSAGTQAELTQIAGTIPYMAPEILGELKAYPNLPTVKPDKTADIYALGVILYLLVTGKHPFGNLNPKSPVAEQCTYLQMQQASIPLSPHALNPAVDRQLSRLILRCLARKPADRPASAAEVAASLRRRFSPWRRTWTAITRRPGLTAAALLVAMTVAVALGGQVANQPSYKDRCFAQGMALSRKGDYSEAIKQFNEAIANGFDGPRPFIVRAAAFQRLGEKEPTYFHNALADLREADARAPSGEAKASMAYCLVRLTQFQPSIALAEDALKLGFDNAETHANLGYALLRVGNSEGAKTQLDFALQKKPNLRQALHIRTAVGLNLTLAAIGKIKPNAKNTPEERELRHAISCMEKAQKLGDRSPDGSLLLAKLHAIAARIDPKEKSAMLRHLRAAMEGGAKEDSAQDILFLPFQVDREFAEIAKIRSPRVHGAPIFHADPLEEIFGK